jgi:tRNA threonylcarbamoyladenosine biosynthesis protein TsaE
MPFERSLKTSSPNETYALGARLSAFLEAGDTVSLSGSLGAGKTALVRGIASGLKVKSHVSSPTFTYLHVHEPEVSGGRTLHHFDVYRLRDASDFMEHGFDEQVGGEVISVVEWGDRVRGVLPDPVIDISVTYGEGQDDRIFQIHVPDNRDMTALTGDCS